ncbi:hypothetical protein AAG906_029319 [Vitis piasezkii]
MNEIVCSHGLGLWRWVETERQIQPLGNNPTLNQIGFILHPCCYLEPIFTRIMACETPKEVWDKLKEMLMEVVNKIRLLGEDLMHQRVVEKVLVSLHERFESKISSLEDSKDLTKISLVSLFMLFKLKNRGDQ